MLCAAYCRSEERATWLSSPLELSLPLFLTRIHADAADRAGAHEIDDGLLVAGGPQLALPRSQLSHQVGALPACWPAGALRSSDQVSTSSRDGARGMKTPVATERADREAMQRRRKGK